MIKITKFGLDWNRKTLKKHSTYFGSSAAAWFSSVNMIIVAVTMNLVTKWPIKQETFDLPKQLQQLVIFLKVVKSFIKMYLWITVQNIDGAQ